MKRYIAQIEVYVYAKSDEQAKEIALQMAKENDTNWDSKANVTKLVRNDHGSLTFTEVK